MSKTRLPVVREIERLIHEITWRDRRQFARLASEFRLSTLQYLTLYQITRLEPGVTMGNAADAIQVPPSSMTNIIDWLMTAGFVGRCVSSANRRAVVMDLTATGEKVIARIRSVRQDHLHNALKHQSDQDLTDLARILGNLLNGMAER